MTYLHEPLTAPIIECFYTVYNELGCGFLESVYEVALMIELGGHGLNASRQIPINVHYHEHVVGRFVADILVERLVMLEIKAAEHVSQAHEAQLINYLRATDIEVGLLLNFGQSPQIRRKIFTNDRKRLGFQMGPYSRGGTEH
jgi:GxxExxY protein